MVLLVALALLFDFMNGFHDAANSIATVVPLVCSARPGGAFLRHFQLHGDFVFHLSVAATVGKGIVQPGVVDARGVWPL